MNEARRMAEVRRAQAARDRESREELIAAGHTPADAARLVAEERRAQLARDREQREAIAALAKPTKEPSTGSPLEGVSQTSQRWLAIALAVIVLLLGYVVFSMATAPSDEERFNRIMWGSNAPAEFHLGAYH